LARNGRDSLSASVVVLGIDPGSLRTGYGVVELRGRDVRPVAWGVAAGTGGSLTARLCAIGRALDAILDLHCPDVVGIEQAFHATNARSTLVLGQARGMVLWLAARRDLPIHEFAPRTVKMSVTGEGGAGKAQVAAMVMRLLALPSRPEADAADALAVALCCARRLGLAGAVAATRRASAAPPRPAAAHTADGASVDLSRAFARVKRGSEDREFARLLSRVRPVVAPARKAPR
jgi:crossover junction endodeoxyribonuclease RuvC